MIAAGGYYFYQKNKSELDKTLENVKSALVESVTESVIDKAKNIDTDELLQIVSDNKELINSFLEKNAISLDNLEPETLKLLLEENDISLDDISIEELKEKLTVAIDNK